MDICPTQSIEVLFRKYVFSNFKEENVLSAVLVVTGIVEKIVRRELKTDEIGIAGL